jgi:hypothetical protein
VKIAWTDPADNYEPIDSYSITIAQNDYATFTPILSSCDGSNAVIFALKACQIPIFDLMAAPFNLKAGDQVIAKVASHNVVGWGPDSDPTNTGALV